MLLYVTLMRDRAHAGSLHSSRSLFRVLWDLELGELVKAELADEPKVFCPLSFFSAPFLCCAGANPKRKPNTNTKPQQKTRVTTK